MSLSKEDMIIKGSQALNDATTQMRKTLGEIITTRRSLRDLKSCVKEFQTKCNVAKTVGTASNVVGAGLAIGGCVCALFTGGTSLLLTASALTTTVAGVGVNTTTEIIDRKKTQAYIKTINDLVSTIQRRCLEIEANLREYEKVVQWLKKFHNLEEPWAIYCIKVLRQKAKNIASTASTIHKGTALFKAANEIYNTMQTMKNIGTFTKSATGGMSYVITKPLNQLSAVERSAIKNSADIVFGRVTFAGKVFQGAFIAINLAVVVFDIVSLVNSWTKNHPAVGVIDDVIEKLDSLERQMTQNLSNMENDD